MGGAGGGGCFLCSPEDLLLINSIPLRELLYTYIVIKKFIENEVVMASHRKKLLKYLARHFLFLFSNILLKPSRTYLRLKIKKVLWAHKQ
jgi:hypothetical protein